jgi:hypothetical protein
MDLMCAFTGIMPFYSTASCSVSASSYVDTRFEYSEVPQSLESILETNCCFYSKFFQTRDSNISIDAHINCKKINCLHIFGIQVAIMYNLG